MKKSAVRHAIACAAYIIGYDTKTAPDRCMSQCAPVSLKS